MSSGHDEKFNVGCPEGPGGWLGDGVGMIGRRSEARWGRVDGDDGRKADYIIIDGRL